MEPARKNTPDRGGGAVTTYALVMVLGSAVVHAGWNLATKKAEGGTAYVFLMAAGSALIWFPLFLWLLVTGKAAEPGTSVLSTVAAVAISGAIHTAYFISLQAGYGCGDLSLVYPLARGTGPLISTFAAILLYGERPSALAMAGALLIGGGAFFLAGRDGQEGEPCDPEDPVGPARAQQRAIAYGLLTGFLIAGYTLWDKFALSRLGLNPMFLGPATNFARAAGMAPFFLLPANRRAEVQNAMHTQWKPALIVSLSSPFSYMLILTALAVSPVSYVAPAREISILLGTLAGTRLLEEGNPGSRKRRLWASAAMAAGVAALAIG